MTAQPLIIEDADLSDVRVVASSLGLRNQKTMADIAAHNQKLFQEKKAVARQAFHREAQSGAELITRVRSGKSTSVQDLVRH